MRKIGKELTSRVWASLTSWRRENRPESKPIDRVLGDAAAFRETIPNVPCEEPEAIQEADDDAESKLIDRRYSKIRLLGSGGFGRVYLVRDDFQDGQEVALKVIHRRYSGTQEIEQRFRREIKILRTITHESVPQIYNDGKTEAGELYFTMRFVPGRSLRDLMDAEAPLEEGRAIRLTIQVAEALVHAHSRDLVHRDLKPSNVQVMSMENGEERIALLDFGIAGSLQGPQAAGVALTASFIGTPIYMAPERMRGRLATAAVDQYALGLVLYEMLSGKEPFSGPTPLEVVESELRVAAPRLGALGSTPELARLIHELVASDPAKRPTAAATVGRLKRILSTPSVRRIRVKRLGFAGLVGVLVISTALMMFRPWDPPKPAVAALASAPSEPITTPPSDEPKPEPPFAPPPKDGEPPTIVCHDFTTHCDPGESYATILDFGVFEVTVTDIVDKDLQPVLSCVPGPFPFGPPIEVTCNAKDRSDNSAKEQKFFIIVKDEEPPTIVCRDFSTHCDPGESYATILDFSAFEVTVTDNVDKNLRPDFGRQPGRFSLGTPTKVTCKAKDLSGNPAQEASFTITVTDEERPVIVPPKDLDLTSDPDESGVPVTFEVKAEDNSGETIVPQCDPSSGSVFRIGPPTPVSITAKDSSGNEALPAEFWVTVTPRIINNPPPPQPLGWFTDPSDQSVLVRRRTGSETRWRAPKLGGAEIEFVSCEPRQMTFIVVVRSKPSGGEPFDSEMALVSDFYWPLPDNCEEPFLIDVHEATKALVSKFEASVSGTPGLGNPTSGSNDSVAMDLSYPDARRIAAWLGKRLPTTVEWHTAARWDGTSLRDYPWGAEFDIDGIKFLDGRPLRQDTDSSGKDASAFGVKACFSGAREWADGAGAGDASMRLMGPCLVDLLKRGFSNNHKDNYRAKPSIYTPRFDFARDPNGSPATAPEDASVRCMIRLAIKP